MKGILLFTFCVFGISAFCQREASKWYFGYKAGLDFGSNIPVGLNNGKLVSLEGVTSVSDATGNLLFYSNGSAVWNKLHDTMANGYPLIGHPSTTQSSIVLKKPGLFVSYYLFTLGQGGAGTLGYSEVDMSLASGAGSVTTKNVTLAVNMTEKMSATTHCNGIDQWVVTHKYNSNEFYAYLVSSASVNPVPVISAVGSVHSSSLVDSYAGALKISPTNKKLGLVTLSNVIEIFDFNPATGQVTNSLLLDTVKAYGCEFSPDGSKFFVSESTQTATPVKFHQWDLCAGSGSAVIASHFTFTGGNSNYSFGGLQLASNGKLYMTQAGMGQSLSEFSNPNGAGGAAGFSFQAIPLTSGWPLNGLPNFPVSMFRQKPKITGNNICGIASFSFNPVFLCPYASDSVTSFIWSFGDPASGTANTSSLAAPTHTYNSNGSFTAYLVTYHSCYSDTSFFPVIISGLPILSITGKSTICKNEQTTFTVSGATSYTWSGGQVTSTLLVNPTATTIYNVTGSFSNSCQSSKTITLTVNPCTGKTDMPGQLAQLNIFPNPSNGILTIESDVQGRFEITDFSGRRVFSGTFSIGSDQIRLNEPPGLYFINIISSGSSAHRKLVIN